MNHNATGIPQICKSFRSSANSSEKAVVYDVWAKQDLEKRAGGGGGNHKPREASSKDVNVNVMLSCTAGLDS